MRWGCSQLLWCVETSACVQMCLIMDEVDGMSAGDRGGVADLIQTLKGAKLPIICICNDKYNQKLKSLRNHCLELDFRWDLCSSSPSTAPSCTGVCCYRMMGCCPSHQSVRIVQTCLPPYSKHLSC